MLSINGVEMILCINQQDKEGNKGVSFLKDAKTGEQFGGSYKDALYLVQGCEYKFCKAHGIKISVDKM